MPKTMDQAAAAGVHDLLSGRQTPLSGLLSKGAQWLVPVTKSTVYYLEGLHLMAAEEGAELELLPPEGLDERELGFLEDFRLRFLGEKVKTNDAGVTILADALHFAWSLLGVARNFGAAPRRIEVPTKLNSALLIGAYGCEHVGDAAILGGVLLGLHKNYGISQVRLLSQRPGHTRRLVASLETPVKVTVSPYDYPNIYEHMKTQDALVFAGGPLMDVPRMLVKHLAAAQFAKRLSKPFLIRNIGVGPFYRRSIEWIAHQIARNADSLGVRTKASADHLVMKGLSPLVGRDPAFDYLESRHELSRLNRVEKDTVSALLAGTEGHLRVGINIRPIDHHWSDQGVEFVKSAEDKLFPEMADAMVRFAALAPRPVTFLFFSMNPIQLGASDLWSAYRLHKAVGDQVDFRVWEADPDVDGVVHFLRSLDITLTMRFHASIFSLSQNIPTIGVDYYPGHGGKVEELFHDLGLANDVRRIDQASTQWICEQLEQKMATAKPDAEAMV